MKSTGQGVFDPGSNLSAPGKPTQLIIERALSLAGLILLTVYAGSRIQGTVLSRVAVQTFETAARNMPISDNLSNKGDASQTDSSDWSESRIQSYRQSLARHFPPALAVLRIPSIQLDVPVLEGTDTLSLNRGIGWIRGTAQPGQFGNIGLAGHRDGFFRRLKDLRVGDRAELVSHDRTDTFVIDNMRVVNPQDVSVLRPGALSLTLVTCYPFHFVGSAPQRYIVHASILRSGSDNWSRTSGRQVYALSKKLGGLRK
jgi:sortase A